MRRTVSLTVATATLLPAGAVGASAQESGVAGPGAAAVGLGPEGSAPDAPTPALRLRPYASALPPAGPVRGAAARTGVAPYPDATTRAIPAPRPRLPAAPDTLEPGAGAGGIAILSATGWAVGLYLGAQGGDLTALGGATAGAAFGAWGATGGRGSLGAAVAGSVSGFLVGTWVPILLPFARVTFATLAVIGASE